MTKHLRKKSLIFPSPQNHAPIKLIRAKLKDNDNIADIVIDADTHNWTRQYRTERTYCFLHQL